MGNMLTLSGRDDSLTRHYSTISTQIPGVTSAHSAMKKTSLTSFLLIILCMPPPATASSSSTGTQKCYLQSHHSSFTGLLLVYARRTDGNLPTIATASLLQLSMRLCPKKRFLFPQAGCQRPRSIYLVRGWKIRNLFLGPIWFVTGQIRCVCSISDVMPRTILNDARLHKCNRVSSGVKRCQL